MLRAATFQDPAAERLARLTPHMRTLGVTRLADITGLDVIGLPVVQAVRPFSLSNAVSQGKGWSLASAGLSALFESIEGYCAERVDRFHVRHGTARKLGLAEMFGNYLRAGAAEAAAPQGNWQDRDCEWVEAEDLLSGKTVLVPFEMVHTAYVAKRHGSGLFHASTTGLAAGFSLEAATRHAILECVERDALARAMASHGFLQRQRVDGEMLAKGHARPVCNVLARAGLLFGVWHAPSPTGLPVAWAHVLEDVDAHGSVLAQPAQGSACRASLAEAADQALQEAVQSRATAIAAARDDFTRRIYQAGQDAARIDAHRRLVKQAGAGLPVDEVPAFAGLGQLLERLAASGLTSVLRVQLDASPLPCVHVVKIIIPGLLPLEEG